jgi:hypothetical protein
LLLGNFGNSLLRAESVMRESSRDWNKGIAQQVLLSVCNPLMQLSANKRGFAANVLI